MSNYDPNELDGLERLIREQTKELPPDMSRVLIEMVLVFISDPGAKSLTLTKVESEDKTHFSIELD